ncbi:MAG: stage II sporulation protein M [Lachnospiraceae bacterium]|nr:stage II sporulation protein M [Lachnospiraceae bacterium]
MIFGKSTVLTETGLLDDDLLRRMQAINPRDGSALFAYVLRRRGLAFLALALLSTTYLGTALCACSAIWYGFALGLFLAVGVARFGIRGVVLFLAAIFPQGLFYLPMLPGLCEWCVRTGRMIYRKEVRPAADKNTPVLLERVLSLLFWAVLLFAGCLLEGFVNPFLLTGWARLL